MITKYDARNNIVITLETETEADIMCACLNWGVSAMSKTDMIDTAIDDDDTRKLARIENDMYHSFSLVHPYQKIKVR